MRHLRSNPSGMDACGRTKATRSIGPYILTPFILKELRFVSEPIFEPAFGNRQREWNNKRLVYDDDSATRLADRHDAIHNVTASFRGSSHIGWISEDLSV